MTTTYPEGPQVRRWRCMWPGCPDAGRWQDVGAAGDPPDANERHLRAHNRDPWPLPSRWPTRATTRR